MNLSSFASRALEFEQECAEFARQVEPRAFAARDDDAERARCDRTVETVRKMAMGASTGARRLEGMVEG